MNPQYAGSVRLNPLSRRFVSERNPKVMRVLAREFALSSQHYGPGISNAGEHNNPNAYLNSNSYTLPGGEILYHSGINIHDVAKLGTDYGHGIHAPPPPAQAPFEYQSTYNAIIEGNYALKRK